MNKNHFKSTLEKLVEIFARNLQVYKSRQSAFNEAQLREQFLNPMFKSLGWDMSNDQGYAEQYKEVIHEDSILIEGKPKAPDYSFRIGEQRKFFLEAKQPLIKIKTDIDPAFQLRRYAWSANLPISILTDFEEFAVYDTSIEPKNSDSASVARIEYFTFDQYAEKWEEIYNLFAKESILKGSFDKYVAKDKKGKQLVDKSFLTELEKWREWLAKDIAENNPSLTVEELNFAVERIMDRIIFLRIAEDRGIERYKDLQRVIAKKHPYTQLIKHFGGAYDKYNSNLFDLNSDLLTPKLQLTDKTLRKVIENLYYPYSPYEFSVLGVEMLGNIYEQFLGKVITLTDSHSAKVEDKPEVKKAGGIFYTPQYIVEYIVKNTIGELVCNKTPKQVEKMRILDPACGSGSFLIGAYEYLLRWHLDYYSKLDSKPLASLEKKGVIYRPDSQKERGINASKTWRLTTNEKKRIMLNNIYGVDIDAQAVEVTKLSLALKMLENENQQTIFKQMRLFPERLLPNLSANIKCGNSLVESDYWHNKDLSEIDERTVRKVNAFDWNQAFKDVMNAGGFDSIIGNPPYIRQELFKEFKPYYERKYSTFSGTADLYIYFIEASIKLIKPKGYYSIIVANKWLRSKYGARLRRYLQSKQIKRIIDFGDLPIFKDATTYPCILTIQGGKPREEFEATNVQTLEFKTLNEYIDQNKIRINQQDLNPAGWALIDGKTQKLLNKLATNSVPLGRYVSQKVFRGVLTGLNEAFVINEQTRKKIIGNDSKSRKRIKPLLLGREIKRYSPLRNNSYLILFQKGWTKQEWGNVTEEKAWGKLGMEYPAITAHLEQYRDKAKKRCDQGDYWWELRACEYYEDFEKPKILFPDIAPYGNYTLDKDGKYCLTNTAYMIPMPDKALLGILNSKLIDFFYSNIAPSYRGGYLRFIYQYIVEIPLKFQDEALPRLRSLVESQLDNHAVRALEKDKDSPKTKIIGQQIKMTDKTIDALVYKLYGLNSSEIRIIEKEMSK